MTEVVRALIFAVRSGLTRVADPGKAASMQAYMKSAMPFHGVPKPVRAKMLKPIFAAHPLPDRVTFSNAVQILWREAEFREERYAAIDLTGLKEHTRHQDADLIPLYEEMIVTGAWWDHVDEVAIRRIGPILRAERERVTPIMTSWARDPDRWRRRTAVICQVGAKTGTDTGLLAHAIEVTFDDRDFFLRKGIGWALREHAKTDPEWVREFVAAHPGLSALSRREALKHLGG
ncbi:DNA alkylation repair protein [Amycolatopsis sp. H20-H5]|uniref:DNA alkylation repair protein n=1 Tax=Amycolatopsis sp. H20-H5 TaxID=3046309 RepID=UPI002DB86824|nr:DNA alkylation repair protein [Amycolatopsis sp. H20-H5]MEC3974054.1 DNA alkylation repair protein [Amycolatopsis sp. H20-H5]